jgi:tetratricopeptide (TPR) repeat protein
MKFVTVAALALTASVSAIGAGAASAQSYMSDNRLKECTDGALAANKRIKACDDAVAKMDPGRDRESIGWALLHRSDLNSSLGKFDEAIVDADKAVTFFPGERHILNAQCWPRAVLNKEIEKAREACDASIEKNPDDPASMDSTGLVALRQERWADAAKWYGKAYSYDKGMTGSLFGIALAAYAQGKTESGDTILKTVQARKPEVIEEFRGYGLTVEGMKAKAPKN